MNINNAAFVDNNGFNQLSANSLLFSLCHVFPSTLKRSENLFCLDYFALNLNLFDFTI